MSPFDGIRPPKKNKNNSKRQPVKQLLDKIHMPANAYQEEKYRLVWVLAAVITLIIALGWGWLLLNGRLNKATSNNNKWQTISDSVGELWDIFKTDVLKLEQVLNQEETSTKEQKIDNLEKKVFPQFEDPQKH